MTKYVVRDGFSLLLAESVYPAGSEIDLSPVQAALVAHMIEPAPEQKPETKSRAK
jgi:hypothetical protein